MTVEKPIEASFPVIGIGASAGGLEAIQELVGSLSTEIQVAFVVVLHLDRSHESYLSEILSKLTAMEVVEAKDGEEIKVRHIYTIPPNTSLTVLNGRLQLTKREDVTGTHLFHPINSLFRSLAESYGHKSIGIVLSGSGSDGTEGVQAIKTNGGTTFAQSKDSAKFDSMPYNAIETGAVDFVLKPDEIAKQLGELVRHPFWSHPDNLSPDDKSSSLHPRLEDRNEIFRQIYKAEKIDFTNYKPSTVNRRVLKRMAVKRVQTFANYAKLLVNDPAEVKALCSDLLIQVTQFFRDADIFEFLKTEAFPKLVKDRANDDPIRIWVAGCSSGQEVYSILIALTEYLYLQNIDFPIQIFGSDINDAAIA